jgi:4-amino-4-deoxy-L-arabinose transferase-like glycosyltransferase
LYSSLLVAAGLRLPDLLALPPHYDEAANAILAADIGLRGERPVFIEGYTGKEAFFFYVAGALNVLLGPELWALRLTAVFLSLLTLSATYWLGWEMFHDRRIALLATILLATSFWHLLFSRLGFRVISQPLWQALMLAAFLRGVRQLGQGRSAWGWFGGAGVALGMAGHTYLAVRLFPVLLLLSSWPLVLDRALWRKLWRPLGLMLFTAVVILSPLLTFFAQNPSAFWVRISQVGTSAETMSLPEAIWRSLLMFGIAGDPYWRYNWPGLPIFAPVWFGLALLGWGMAAWQLWRAEDSHGRVIALLLLLNPLIMLLPTALARNEILPSNIRAFGLIPLIFYLPALATVRLLDWQPLAQPLPRWAWLGGFTLLLLLQTSLAADRYYTHWHGRVDLFYETDGDLAAIAAQLNQAANQPANQPIFIGSRFYQHPTVALLAENYPELRWLIESRALVFPPADSPNASYFFPATSPLPLGLQRLLETAQPTVQDGPMGPDNRPVFTHYQLTQAPVLSPTRPLNANFGYGLTLLGADVGSGAGGATLPLTLYWQVMALPQNGAEWVPFVHLEDRWGYRWSQQEPNPYPTAQWREGERWVQEVAVLLPEGMPPGQYRLRVGLFDPATGQAVPRYGALGAYAGSGLTLEDVFVVGGTTAVVRHNQRGGRHGRVAHPHPHQPHPQPMGNQRRRTSAPRTRLGCHRRHPPTHPHQQVRANPPRQHGYHLSQSATRPRHIPLCRLGNPPIRP